MQESGEMYLESILVLGNEKENVRSIDVAEHMGYSKASISRAMSKLRKDGYIVIDGNGHITLTDSGRKIAETIYDRHIVLTGVLRGLGVDEETAVNDACKIEHYISEKSFEAMKKYIAEHQRS